MQPESLARAVVDAYNRHDLARLGELHDTTTARIVFAGVPGHIGLAAWFASMLRLFTILPDFAIRPLSLVADDHRALVELRLTGTNRGPLSLDDADRALLGTDADRLPPTGRAIDVGGVVALDTTRGRVVEERHYWPRYWLYEALGLLTVAALPRCVAPSDTARS